MSADAINALFEGVGAVLAWASFWRLVRDREVKGVFWPATVFWAAWGVWNLWFYPSVGAMLSFYAGVVLCAGNLAWVIGLAVIRVGPAGIHDRDTLPDLSMPIGGEGQILMLSGASLQWVDPDREPDTLRSGPELCPMCGVLCGGPPCGGVRSDRLVEPAETPVGRRLIHAVEWAAPVDVVRVDCAGRNTVIVTYRPHVNALLTPEDLTAMALEAGRVLPKDLRAELVEHGRAVRRAIRGQAPEQPEGGEPC